MKIFSGSSNTPLAEKIAQKIGIALSPIEHHIFPDGERRIKLNDSVTGEDTIVVQSTATPVDQNYTELFFMIDALKRSGAKSVIAVIPYLGYQRQDHVFREGEAVSLQVMIRTLESLDVDKIIVLDLHSIKIPEFFHVPLVHLSALPLFAEEIKNIVRGPVGLLSHPTSSNELRALDGSPTPPATPLYDNFILVSPDMGGLRRIQKMSEYLDGMPWIATVKDRNLETGEISIHKIETLQSGLEIDDLKGKSAFIVDDMVSSGKTLVQSVELLRKYGIEDTYAFITHPIFSEEAPRILEESMITKVFTTDSVYVPREKHFRKLEELTISDMIAEKLKVQS
jgi:ribose-phosphate pyrophosphokinase